MPRAKSKEPEGTDSLEDTARDKHVRFFFNKVLIKEVTEKLPVASAEKERRIKSEQLKKSPETTPEEGLVCFAAADILERLCVRVCVFSIRSSVECQLYKTLEGMRTTEFRAVGEKLEVTFVMRRKHQQRAVHPR